MVDVVSLDLDKVETGYNLLVEWNALTRCLIVHIPTALIEISFITIIPWARVGYEVIK